MSKAQEAKLDRQKVAPPPAVPEEVSQLNFQKMLRLNPPKK
jgi:hypothetical protein